jgi:hypothetical protein
MKPVGCWIIICLLGTAIIATAMPVNAQEPLNLIIKPDGTVSPATELLERNGATYTFTGDIFGTIWVQTNNIIIDGAGYTLEGDGVESGQNSDIGVLLGGPDLSHRICNGVLVENLRIFNIPRGIFTVGSSNNSFIGNYLENAGIEIQGGASLAGNLIFHNTIINGTISFDYYRNVTDTITENNFFDSQIAVWLANPPISYKNYWSNYTAIYPDAEEIDQTGIWDTPYVSVNYYGYNSTDMHPLVNPVVEFAVTDFNSRTLTEAAQTPTATPSPTGDDIAVNPAFVVAGIIIVVTVIIAIASILKRKRR